MPRTRKPRQEPTPAAGEDDEGGSRPSQLDQIRAAMAETPASARKETPELPAPDPDPELPAPADEPELPAPVDEPELPAHAEEAEPPPPDVSEPVAAATAAEPAAAAAVATEPAPAPAPAPASGWVPPPTHAPAAGAPMAVRAAPARPGSSGLALGIVLVVVGVFFLVMRLFDIDLSSYGWPLYVIIPGLTLAVVGFVSLGSGALIPGGIITMAGLVLAYQNATGDWASWAYAWALVAPGGVGVGLFLNGLRNHDAHELKQGRSLMFWALMIFFIGFVFFESILNISGIDYGIVGRAALPALLIVIGVTLLARSWQRSRKT